MIKLHLTLVLFSTLLLSTSFAQEVFDYHHYHVRVIEAEQLIVNEDFQKALMIYDTLFEN